MPTAAIQNILRGCLHLSRCQLLYHEATFDASLRTCRNDRTFNNTRRRKDCMEASAGDLVIGHFSARYKIFQSCGRSQNDISQYISGYDGKSYMIGNINNLTHDQK